MDFWEAGQFWLFSMVWFFIIGSVVAGCTLIIVMLSKKYVSNKKKKKQKTYTLMQAVQAEAMRQQHMN